MLIRVLEIPRQTSNFHFLSPEPQAFMEVDWFRDDEHSMMATPEGRAEIEKFIRAKKYFDPRKAYLVLCQINTFTINYIAP